MNQRTQIIVLGALAVAIESQGYRGEEGRMPIREYRVRPSDAAVLAVGAALLVAALLV
jgi:energy-coupling factor transporter transmembrane protein EcfT